MSIELWWNAPKKLYIRVDEQWWQPWANTIIYYNFANNVNDQSWNNNNATASWTISYGTNYVDLTSWKLQVPDMSYANDMTISFWTKCNAASNTGALFDVINSGHNKIIFRIEWVKMYSDYPSYSPYNYTYSTSRRYLVATFDSSWVKYYIDGALVATETAWSSTPWASGWSYIWAHWDGGWWNPQLYAWYFIIEDKARTATEISDYYNLTKWDYWL